MNSDNNKSSVLTNLVVDNNQEKSINEENVLSMKAKTIEKSSSDEIVLQKNEDSLICKQKSLNEQKSKIFAKSLININNVNSNLSSSSSTSLDENDDAASIVSRLSQIVVEQEEKLLFNKSTGNISENSLFGNNNKRDANNNNNKFEINTYRRSSTALALACDDDDNNQENNFYDNNIFFISNKGTRRSTGSRQHLNKRRHLNSETSLNVTTTTTTINNNNSFIVNNDDNNLNKKRNIKGSCENIVMNKSNAPLFMRRNESSGFLPERGDLRQLESLRNKQQQQQLQSPISGFLRNRSNTAGSIDNKRLILANIRKNNNNNFNNNNNSGSGSGDDLIMNIKRSAWKLSDFDQTFEIKSNNDNSFECNLYNKDNSTDSLIIINNNNNNQNNGKELNKNQKIFTVNYEPSSINNNNKSKNLIQTTNCENNQQLHSYSPAGIFNDNDNNHNTIIISNKNRLLTNNNNETNINININDNDNNNNNNNNCDNKLSVDLGSRIRKVSLNGQEVCFVKNNRRPSNAPSITSLASSIDSFYKGASRKFNRLNLIRNKRNQRSETNNRLATTSANLGTSTKSINNNNNCYDDHDDYNKKNCFDLINQCFPILNWLPKYKKSYLIGDIMAGFAVAIMNISISISAAVVAETELSVAFRASIINTFIYSIFCSSNHTAFGSWSIMSQMLLVSVQKALNDEYILDRLNLGKTLTQEEYDNWHYQLIIMYTFSIGLIQLICGFLNLGSILASFIPEALCSSMIAATAITMAIGQLANMCGTTNKILWSIEKNTTQIFIHNKDPQVDITDVFAGLFNWLKQIAILLKHYEQINLICALISITAVILLFFNQYILQNFLEKLFKKKISIPFEMLLVVIFILISYYFELNLIYKVPTCGPINGNFNLPDFPDFRLIRELWDDSLTTALISYTMTYIMAKTYANKFNYEVDFNQELIACGAGNLIGGLFDALPATASFGRTGAQVEAGGKTQLASIINCFVLLAIIQLLGEVVTYLPTCLMSACLFFSFVKMMTKVSEVFLYWRICKVDFVIWIVSFVAILTMDILNGFIYGFIFSILTMLYRAQNRRCYMLGSIEDSEVYVPLVKYPMAKEIDGIKIFQFCGPIHYVCADLFEQLLRQRTHVNVKQILSTTTTTDCAIDSDVEFQNKSNKNLPSHIILDFSMISYIDSAGLHMIKKIIEDYQRINITILIASLASHVASVVKSEPSLWNNYKDRFYVGLPDAVHCARRDNNYYRQQQLMLSNFNRGSATPPLPTINVVEET